ncbi:hypothetical protein [uncultured Gimesia sp.]|uniref:hypothetical protein n=1 Tax=uncultured Gimesia sp. TaxID=1678688 RepID=UPI002621F39B|nr:hypothetical protein [uncultured Gimesia sp.]
MIYVFWALAVPTGACSALLILMSLAGQSLSSATPVWLTLLASLGVFALLVWAFRVARKSGRPGAACGMVFLSWVLFAVIMIANGLAHQNGWQ